MTQWQNTITGGVLFLFSLVLYFLVPYQIDIIETGTAQMAPSFYPKLVIVTLAGITLIFIIVSLFEESKKKPPVRKERSGLEDVVTSDRRLVRAFITITITLVYIYIFEILGFFVATPLLLGAMLFHMGNRRILTFFLVMTITPLVIYVLFERVMVIILPKGIFF